MFIAKAFYFFFFAAAACLIPFLTLYYRGLGLSGSQIGFLTGIVPLISMLGSSLWSMIADAGGRHRLIMLITISGVCVSVFFMSQAQSFSVLILIVIAYAFFGGSIIPMADNAVMAMLGDNKADYGRQRIGGSFGWGISAIIIGIIIEQQGLIWSFYGYLLFMIILLFVATRLPMSVASAKGRFWAKIGRLTTDRDWLIFLAIATVEGMCLGIFLNYLFLYLEELAFSAVIMALTLTFATISEIPIFLYSRRLLGKWSPQVLLAFSLLLVVVRAFSYVWITASWQVLAISLLHGPTFGLMWIAGVAYADRTAPSGLGATAQGVFGGLTMGLGVAVGTMAGGVIYDAYGAVNLFRYTGFLALLALLVYLWIYRSTFLGQLRARRMISKNVN